MRNLFFAVVSSVLMGVGAFAATPENTLVIELDGASTGIIEIELLPEIAPEHVERIKKLAREGSYDGVVFHRVIDGFMAQTGDVTHGNLEGFIPRYAGSGGSNYEDLPAEFSKEPFLRGVVGMARSSEPDSANSQFFIMFADGEFLNEQYTVFGRVIEGQDVVDGIKKGHAQTGALDDPDYMKRVYVKSDN
ncbi:peptidyl-prolyl cis-trans isomerase [Amylibacter ulvae]|uniref:Peptidyl-prolyl cis-trans isomerase n=2 Tax=Paramylibacter ulvae TaxID=1651968 RepID=A0ABQ3CT38_9RHOB|nr:peptidyl-prolyl cis-trans isomerase [Amylibacter ulvae]